MFSTVSCAVILIIQLCSNICCNNKMQKEDLLKFIKCQVKECLNQIKELDQMEAYFFWQIMDLVCRKNGNLMMAQVTTILFKGYGFIRKKVRGTEDLKYSFFYALMPT
ncbi:hypothetical protein AMELA_G00027020 [Ameiurus melas]|uniref:Uncharacterized protein n=1 Tax=Ameiurus melas TaxID=219545 RepID=A0A7J6BDQ0_AMEME|nr:hypothetical protein AMELA_G00027020 [Ameiurus melas]